MSESALSPAVTYNVADGVATLTLARPDARNVLDAESLGLLVQHFAAAAADDSVRVVVLTGEGRAFCAGADLRGAASGDAGGFKASGPQALVDVLTAMLDHPKPIIARVQGHVAGGGNGLVAAADLSIAVENATFAFSEVRVGVAPAVISVVTLRRMSPTHAAELLLTGERVSATRAFESGLINAVVHEEALDAHVARWVSQLRLGGPEAVARTKELLRRVPTMTRDEAFAYTAELSAGLFSSAEAAEGMTAFLQKRPAAWAPTAD
jgi:methylglutaconyl-CoA hydratase